MGDYDTYYGGMNANRIVPKAVSTKNSRQEIVESNLYHTQLAFMQNGASEGQEALSAAFYNVEMGHSVTGAHTILRDTLESTPVGLTYTRTGAKAEGPKEGRDGAGGDKRQYKVVTYYDSTIAGTTYASFVCHRFTSYDGSEKAVWLMDGQSLNSRTELYSQGTVH